MAVISKFCMNLRSSVWNSAVKLVTLQKKKKMEKKKKKKKKKAHMFSENTFLRNDDGNKI